MKTVAICYPQIQKNYPDVVVDDFNFCNLNIPIGLLSIDSSIPTLKSENDVLVKVNAFSCNYRDRALLLKFNEKCRDMTNHNQIIYSPFGSEFVATIIDIGKNVTSFNIGDRVIADCHYSNLKSKFTEGVPTNYASQRLHVFHEGKLIKIPNMMRDDVAASFSICSQTAYSMIRKANVQSNDKILITAATSNTSLSVIKALKNQKVQIFATSSNNENEEWLYSWGIDEFIPINTLLNREFPDFMFDTVIDPFFDLYLCGIIDSIKHYGKYIYCGLFEQHQKIEKSSQLFEENYKDVLIKSMIKNISIIGNCIGYRSDLEVAIEDYEKGIFDIAIDSTFSNLDIIPFLERSFKDTSRKGKVVYKYED